MKRGVNQNHWFGLRISSHYWIELWNQSLTWCTGKIKHFPFSREYHYLPCFLMNYWQVIKAICVKQETLVLMRNQLYQFCSVPVYLHSASSVMCMELLLVIVYILTGISISLRCLLFRKLLLIFFFFLKDRRSSLMSIFS